MPLDITSKPPRLGIFHTYKIYFLVLQALPQQDLRVTSQYINNMIVTHLLCLFSDQAESLDKGHLIQHRKPQRNKKQAMAIIACFMAFSSPPTSIWQSHKCSKKTMDKFNYKGYSCLKCYTKTDLVYAVLSTITLWSIF